MNLSDPTRGPREVSGKRYVLIFAAEHTMHIAQPGWGGATRYI